MGRYKSVTPVTDFSVSQRIKVALIEDGHTDLAIEAITKPIRELEEEHALLQKRVRALELEKVNFQTESGVHRLIDAKVGKAATDWSKWGTRLALAAALAALGKWMTK